MYRDNVFTLIITCGCGEEEDEEAGDEEGLERNHAPLPHGEEREITKRSVKRSGAIRVKGMRGVLWRVRGVLGPHAGVHRGPPGM